MKCNRSPATMGAAVLVVIMVIVAFAPNAWAGSKYKTLHMFTGGADGSAPQDQLILDTAGNLYGTTTAGGAYGNGTVFELTKNSDGTWTESVLYSFAGGTDGATPQGAVIFDASGNLYGSTEYGGNSSAGTVFELVPNSDGTWTESVLHRFTGKDGSQPFGALIFDHEGNLYSATGGGGNSKCQGLFSGCGVVFKLAPNGDGTWTESVLHRFTGGKDGQMPQAGVIFDQAGNLYGTTRGGGHIFSDCTDWEASGCGVVYELTPGSGGSWKEKVLHSFTRKDGMWPIAAPVFDAAGNLYGTTQKGASSDCGAESCGTVFELAPKTNSRWREKVLDYFNGKDGNAPDFGPLIFDTAGSLYGTTGGGGPYGDGNVFKLTPMSGGKRWKEAELHVYKSPGVPVSGLIFDGAGNLYGTTQGDFATNFGSVFEITR